MSEERDTLQKLTTEALEWGLGSTWGRLAPLSAGAIVTSAVVVGGVTLVQRLVGGRGRRWLAFLGGASLIPLAVVILYSGRDDEAPGSDADETGAEAGNGADEAEG